MTDKLNPTILQALNLTEDDFEPKTAQTEQNAQNNADARIAELEQAIRILLGGEIDAE